MRDYGSKQQRKEEIAAEPVTGLMPGAVPSHIVEWGPGVNVTLRGVAYLGSGEGYAADHGCQPHRLIAAGQP